MQYREEDHGDYVNPFRRVGFHINLVLSYIDKLVGVIPRAFSLSK